MRLKTRLMLVTSSFAVLLTALLCAVFFNQLLRGRIDQAYAANEVLARELLLSTRTSLEKGLVEHPPATADERGLEEAVTATLRDDDALTETMSAIVNYSPTVQDVFLSSASGRVLVSSNASMTGTQQPQRRRLSAAADETFTSRMQLLFGPPMVMDLSLPLERNGQPFLNVHVGVRSSLLRNALAPWLREAGIIGVAALGLSLAAALLLSALALRPIELINRRLTVLAAPAASAADAAHAESRRRDADAVSTVSSTIELLDRQIRTSARRETELATNLSQMLRTLTDGVLLLSDEGTVIMASESARNFLPGDAPAVLEGMPVVRFFAAGSEAGDVLAAALARRRSLLHHPAVLEGSRVVELSLSFAPSPVDGAATAMLTLHDRSAREEVEHEIDLARRLASIGRLAGGVGHEVKNPINAMVLHLELLRGKLQGENGDGAGMDGAARHVEVLSSEMRRLDRVVQTFADFSRPLEPALMEQPLAPLLKSLLELIAVDAQTRSVNLILRDDTAGRHVLVDSELLHQALLNIALNALEAMPNGGILSISAQREAAFIIIRLRDTGSGIPAERLQQIFQLYFTTKPTGSGIGLAMTSRLIQMMGGSVDVESDAVADSPTRGTLFSVRLPAITRSTRPARPIEVRA